MRRGISAFEINIAAISEEDISCPCLLFRAAEQPVMPMFFPETVYSKELDKNSRAWSWRVKKKKERKFIIAFNLKLNVWATPQSASGIVT